MTCKCLSRREEDRWDCPQHGRMQTMKFEDVRRGESFFPIYSHLSELKKARRIRSRPGVLNPTRGCPKCGASPDEWINASTPYGNDLTYLHVCPHDIVIVAYQSTLL